MFSDELNYVQTRELQAHMNGFATGIQVIAKAEEKPIEERFIQLMWQDIWLDWLVSKTNN